MILLLILPSKLYTESATQFISQDSLHANIHVEGVRLSA